MSHRHSIPTQTLSPASRTGRKTLKYKRLEPVWSVILEEALLQGLAAYRPSSARDPSLLQRFPRRNKWISDYIFQQTGTTRTAKQVGSRLQQLRETCEDPEILGLIINKTFRSSQDTLSSQTRTHHASSGRSCPSDISTTTSSTMRSSVSSTALRTSPSFDSLPPRLSASPSVGRPLPTKISVALVLHENDLRYGHYASTSAFTLDLDEQGFTDAHPFCPNPSMRFTHSAEIRTAAQMSSCMPTVNLSSSRLPTSAKYRSISCVYRDGALVYTDARNTAFLEPFFYDDCPSSPIYSTGIVPEYWAAMARDPQDYHRFTVTQDILSVSPPTSGIYKEHTIFSIDYNFERGAPSLSQGYTIQDLPPSMTEPSLMSTAQYDISVGYDYSLLADPSFDFSDPQLSPYTLPLLPHPSACQYSRL